MARKLQGTQPALGSQEAVLVIFWISTLLASAADLPFRDWTDRDNHQVRARMVGWADNVVRLRLLFDGKVIEMPEANLIQADRDYVAELARTVCSGG